MKIVVLVKYVPEPTATWRFAEDLTLDRTGIDGRLSELDEYAVEQAIRLAEAGVPVEISYLTMGPARAVEGLRKALAMSGERAVHVVDDAIHGSDALATSLILATALRRMGFDLIITGMASTDAEMSVVPVMVADRLGVPAIANAVALRVDDSAVTVRRDTDDATEEVTAPLPALVSVTDRSGEARYPSFKSIIAGKKKPVTTWSLADLEIAPELVGAAAAPSASPTGLDMANLLPPAQYPLNPPPSPGPGQGRWSCPLVSVDRSLRSDGRRNARTFRTPLRCSSGAAAVP